jgi:hypothetical protein
MLANLLSVASVLCTCPWYRIPRTRTPNTVTKLPYQRCVHYCKNPQSNAVCERMHQTVRNVLRMLLHGNPLQNIVNAAQYVVEALSIAMHAMQAGVHSTLGSSPGNLVFNRDMFLNIPLISDWHAITQRREHLIHENLMRENQKRRGYDYVLVYSRRYPKYSRRTLLLYPSLSRS